jgi:hypothetical protein
MGEAGKRDSGGGWGWIGMERTKGVYPLVNIQKEIVDLPIKNGDSQ